MTLRILVLWQEGDWRCELHVGFAGHSRLEIYRDVTLVTAESTPSGEAAQRRADVLRQRVLRGDLH